MGWSVGKQSVSVVPRTDVGGRALDGRPTAVTDGAAYTIKATVNPVPGGVLLTLPEGERRSKNLRVLTETELNVADDYADIPGDYVVIRGEVYEVRDVQEYEQVIPHFEYRVRRLRPEVAAP